MKPIVVRNIERPDPCLVRKLGEYGVATVHEAQGRAGLMLPYMRPIFPAARIAAPAVTVLCHAGDNLMIHAAIEVCKPGDVVGRIKAGKIGAVRILRQNSTSRMAVATTVRIVIWRVRRRRICFGS